MNFSEYITFLSTNALLGLGVVENPITGEKKKNLKLVKFTIEILELLKVKTKGNLEPEEATLLETTIANLWTRYKNEETEE